MFYDSVTKQVRNSYQYSWGSAGFGLNRHDNVANSLRGAITYLEILQYVEGSITNWLRERRMHQFQNECSSFSSCSIDPAT